MLPEKITLPGPSDFCKKMISTADGRRCTMIWFSCLFPMHTRREKNRFIRHWHKSADEIGIPDHIELFDRNDDRKTTLKQLAAAFEKTVESLGYSISEE